MAMDGLLVLVCAGAILAGPTAAAAPADDRDTALAVTLAVQTAMQQGRECLLRNDPRAAVEALERQLPRINGNPAYLSLLRDAYRSYVKSLRLAGQEGQAQLYAQRLAILDPAAVEAARPAARAPAAREAVAAPAVFRGKQDDDPFRQGSPVQGKARDLVAEAEREFGRSHYRDADQLFDQAHQADPALIPSAGRERWAYCKMYQVVEQLNGPTPAYGDLEARVRAALALRVNPRMESYGQQLLAEIERRRTGSGHSDGAADVRIQDRGRTADGWSVAETTNFRIFHNLGPDWIDRVARVAEETRARMQRKWFGEGGPAWDPKCEVFLYATADQYSRATGVSRASPGHSSFQFEGGRVLARRIDLHCDDPGVLIGVLPHEATHVVLAGRFGEQPVPRWADEGMAVLTEPADKIDRHVRNLPRHRQDNQLFPLRQLVNMADYPPPQYVGVFYAQSVSLVDFLSRERGATEFTRFVRDGMRDGYEASLRNHYGYRDFDELERRWQAFAFRPATPGVGVAQSSH